MGVIFVIIFALVVVYVLWQCIGWLLHADTTCMSRGTYGRASFKEFKEQFEMVDWNYSRGYDALYVEDTMNGHKFSDFIYPSLSEIKFNDDRMIMRSPLSYFLAKMYVREYLNKGFHNKKKMYWRPVKNDN